MFHTDICDILNIKYPILQGAMSGVTDARFVAAVSNAGALGVLATAYYKADQIRDEIRRTKDLTDKPFAVNLVPMGQGFEKLAELTVSEGVRIATTGRGDPRTPVVQLLKEQGIKVIPVVPTVRHAVRLEEEGADIIVASGCEAGGHVGKVSTLPLIPQVVDAVKVPVVAAGGFADARGFLAALALGASGVQIGTRFIATHESTAHKELKELILKSSEEQTTVSTIFTGKPVRVILNDTMREYLNAEAGGATEEELKAKKPKNSIDGNYRPGGTIAAGQVSGMIREMVSVKELIDEIIDGAREISVRLQALSVGSEMPIDAS
jgi:enoyl-[acyl-carrier protein] reductase II